MTETTTTVTIPRAEYDRLVKEADLLRRLEAAGVDDWDGYSDAARAHRRAFPDDED